MTWTLVGWVFIGCAAVLLLISIFIRFENRYPIRQMPAIAHLRKAQSASMETGRGRWVLLGDRFIPQAYPGLGLHALSVLPMFLSMESGVDGGLTLGSADGSLAVFARQVVQNNYRDGFSPVLHQAGAQIALYGPTPLSFTAGLLPELSPLTSGSLALFGHYGPESLLWVDAVQRRHGAIFASGGSLAAQAVLFLSVRDVLIGEATFAYPQAPAPDNRAARQLLTEDVLRLALILGLLIGVGLKLGGVL